MRHRHRLFTRNVTLGRLVPVLVATSVLLLLYVALTGTL